MNSHRSFHHTLLMVLVCVLPLFLFIILALNGIELSPLLFLLLIMVCCGAMMYFMHGGPAHAHDNTGIEEAIVENGDSGMAVEGLKDVMEIRHSHKVGNNVVFEGKLLDEPDAVHARLKERFKQFGREAILQEDDSGDPILVLVPAQPDVPGSTPRPPWINGGLFLLTLVTTTWAGAAHRGVDLLTEPGRFSEGLPYALALMLILTAHELGHYFAARYHGMKVTLPYFIPVPFALGTFGAFIQLKSPSENRRSLFDVGIAGPIAGLVIAIPALFIGLQTSTVIPFSGGTPIVPDGMDAGSSVLMALLVKMTLGDAVLQGHQLVLSPLAFAGWLGLLVTALNLLPIGQLDGGHIAHALFGRKNSNTIGMVALFSLLLLGLFVWSGLLTWAIIVFFIAGTKSAPPLNDVSKLEGGRVVLGAVAFILLFLILIPVPHAFYQSMGIHCPYI